MKTIRHVSALATLLLLPTWSYGAVPPVDSVGKPAVVICTSSTAGSINAVHMDKVIFVLNGQLQAINGADQIALNAIPRGSELDIKVLDNPKTVADLKGKVLSFLGAVDNADARKVVTITDVEYAVVCPAVKQPTTAQ